MNVTLVWFRQDLRLQDNSALHAAAKRGAIVPLYILDTEGEGRWRPGAAGRWWLHHSLAALDHALRMRASRLLLARGDSLTILRALARRTGANAVFWNRRYEPHAVAGDTWIESALRADDLEIQQFNAALLHEPAEILNRQGRPFQLFTPYWRQCAAAPVRAPVKLADGPLPAPPHWPDTLELDTAGLFSTPELEPQYRPVWEPGEAGALARWQRFLSSGAEGYGVAHEEPAREGTSMLSPHLHFGEIGPRQIWAALRGSVGSGKPGFAARDGRGAFLRELGWRDFAHQLLFHFPQTPVHPLREAFARFPWAEDPQDCKLRAWQCGVTGYPMVDAGMRQLRQTGWMHERARMIVASFLARHLRLPWTAGAAWFWEMLVDADLANNTLGWQWSAGCGADSTPYIRAFAPVVQGQKFDRAGTYVRRWVPELARLPPRYIHAPWEAPHHVLAAAEVRLGDNYPRPIVDDAAARAEALAAFQRLRDEAPPGLLRHT